MDTQTWATMATVLASMATLLGLLYRKFDKIDARISTEIGTLRAEMTTSDAQLRGAIDTLGTSLRAEMNTSHTELQSQINSLGSSLRAEMGQGFGHVQIQLGVLEQRTYDIGVRLGGQPAAGQPAVAG